MTHRIMESVFSHALAFCGLATVLAAVASMAR